MTQIHRLTVGDLRANCYIIEKAGRALLVDPGANFDQIKNLIDDLEVTLEAVLLTHAHYDHIGALDDVRDTYGVEAYLSPIEQDWLGDPHLNLSGGSSWKAEITARPAEHSLEMDKSYHLAGFDFKVVACPGHSPGSVSYVFADEEFVMCGDLIFKNTVGRTDLPFADFHELKNSIRREIFTLDPDFTLYPGHGDSTRVGHEKDNNPFFN